MTTSSAVSADQYWHLNSSDYENTQTILRTIRLVDIRLGSLNLPASQAGDFME
jgi:hypothetical protein